MENNPIMRVDDRTGIPGPSSYVWELEDVSSEDGGRTEDINMHKKRIGQVKGVELAWQNVSIPDASLILKAFNPEYVHVTYLDAMEGDWITAEFYVGNRSAVLYNSTLGVWESISFKLIKRKGEM